MNGHNMIEPPFLTIAVICKNEAANIERCLSSIVSARVGISSEIIVVDSFSTDGTVELAQNFPVTIVQLGRDWPHSPAAGRYTAVRHARGQYLLLIDGDMELFPGYIPAALAQMESDPAVVAVRGRLHNYHWVGGKFIYVSSVFSQETASNKSYIDATSPVAIGYASGSAVFRLQAIREAGNFHPYLQAEEEYEIAQRLLTGERKILYIPCDAVNHYGYLPDPLAELGRRLRRGLVGGVGQMARLAFQEGYGWKNLTRFRQQLLIGCFLLLLIPALLLSPLSPWPLLFWLLGSLFLLLAYYKRKPSFRSALAACLYSGLIGIDILKGLLSPIPAKENYPTAVSILCGQGGSKGRVK